MARIGRPPKGSGARSKVVSVRLTPTEEEHLTRSHGTPSRGLQQLVAEAMKRHPAGKAQKGRLEKGEAVVPLENPDVDENIVTARGKRIIAEGHRHKRGRVIDTDYDAGSKVLVYECKVEGCQEKLR